jgi:hypothetical protein
MPYRSLQASWVSLVFALVAPGCATALDAELTIGAGHDSAAIIDTAHADDSAAAKDTTTGSDAPTTDDGVDGGPSDGTSDSASSDTSLDGGKLDTGAPDTGTADSGTPDTGTGDAIVTTDGGVTTVTFPSTASSTKNSSSTIITPLGAGGGGVHYVTGEYCEESFPRATPVSKLDLDFRMSDLTTGCSTGATLSWDVKLNGTKVGSYSFVSTSGFGDRSIVQSFTFGAIAPASGAFTIRLEATTTVCPGGSSWNWYPGGTAKLQ